MIWIRIILKSWIRICIKKLLFVCCNYKLGVANFLLYLLLCVVQCCGAGVGLCQLF